MLAFLKAQAAAAVRDRRPRRAPLVRWPDLAALSKRRQRRIPTNHRRQNQDRHIFRSEKWQAARSVLRRESCEPIWSPDHADGARSRIPRCATRSRACLPPRLRLTLPRVRARHEAVASSEERSASGTCRWSGVTSAGAQPSIPQACAPAEPCVGHGLRRPWRWRASRPPTSASPSPPRDGSVMASRKSHVEVGPKPDHSVARRPCSQRGAVRHEELVAQRATPARTESAPLLTVHGPSSDRAGGH
jgi:hypothetical protein